MNNVPIDMVLHCPKCGMQHIDVPGADVDANGPCYDHHWDNPPHRSHLCHGCGHIWRPADVPTNGVQEIKTKGKNDSPEPNFDTQNEAQGFAVEAVHQFCPELRFREDGQTLLTPAQVETILRRCGWKPPGEWEPPQPIDRIRQKAAYWDFLVELAGHWQDGSSQPVTLTDDDACRVNIIRWGHGWNEKRVVGGSFESCIQQIMKERG